MKSDMLRSLVLLLLFAAAGPAPAADPLATPHRVADLAWLAGHWRGLGDEKDSEEIWTEPKNGTMVGMYRESTIGKSMFEFLILEDDAKGIVKRFRHYRKGFQEVEKEPLMLRASELTTKKVVFTPSEEGKLKSIIYELDGSDKVNVTVNTTRNDKPFKIAIAMERVKGK